jgi:hypothetical protein
LRSFRRCRPDHDADLHDILSVARLRHDRDNAAKTESCSLVSDAKVARVLISTVTPLILSRRILDRRQALRLAAKSPSSSYPASKDFLEPACVAVRP